MYSTIPLMMLPAMVPIPGRTLVAAHTAWHENTAQTEW